MRGLFVVSMLLILAAPAFAWDGDNVTYAGGTASKLKEGSAGKFDYSSAAQLRFVSAGDTLEIPYKGMESFEHSKELAVHLGVAPAIAVGLVAARKRNHYVRITYKDGNQLPQVAVFEVQGPMLRFLMPMLEARAPQAQCGPYADCTPKPRIAVSKQQAPAATTEAAPPSAPATPK